MIILYGKIYLPEKHFPWTLQRNHDWNSKRAFLYLEEMQRLKRQNYYPYCEENRKVISKINIQIENLEKNKIL